jgi:hypothetical protein
VETRQARTKVVVSLLALVGLLGLSPLAMAEDPVVFGDPDLKDAVERRLGISDPTPTDMLSLTSLNARHHGIADLTGIEYATNLTDLDLGGNQISDISVLWGLTNLTWLNLGGNQVSDISVLSGLTNLTWLWLQRNQISDISPLSGLTNLTWLFLYRNQISDISALSGLTNLEILSLEYNRISDISPVSGLTNLTWLSLHYNQLSDISPLSGLTNLTILSLYGNPLNVEAYCIYLPLIEANNYGINLRYDPNPEDSDGDMVVDVCDNCPESNLDSTITIADCDSGVENKILDNGCTMNDMIAQCADTATRRWEFMLCVNRLTTTWQREGLISWRERWPIMRCAMRSSTL